MAREIERIDLGDVIEHERGYWEIRYCEVYYKGGVRRTGTIAHDRVGKVNDLDSLELDDMKLEGRNEQ